MGVIYKPFGILLGILAGLVGKRIFNVVWTKIDDEDPPKATTEEADWSKILAAAAVQGVIFRVTRVVVDRYEAESAELLDTPAPGGFQRFLSGPGAGTVRYLRAVPRPSRKQLF